MSDSNAASLCGIRTREPNSFVETWCGRHLPFMDAQLAEGAESMTCLPCRETLGGELGLKKAAPDGGGVCAQRSMDHMGTVAVVTTWCGRAVSHIEAVGKVTPDSREVTCDKCIRSLEIGGDMPARPVAASKTESLLDQVAHTVTTTKIEDGDLVVVMLQRPQPSSTRRRMVKHLQDIVTDDMGVNAKVIVIDDGIDISVVKKAELGDLHQRIDDLEAKLQYQLSFDPKQ